MAAQQNDGSPTGGTLLPGDGSRHSLHRQSRGVRRSRACRQQSGSVAAYPYRPSASERTLPTSAAEPVHAGASVADAGHGRARTAAGGPLCPFALAAGLAHLPASSSQTQATAEESGATPTLATAASRPSEAGRSKEGRKKPTLVNPPPPLRDWMRLKMLHKGRPYYVTAAARFFL